MAWAATPESASGSALRLAVQFTLAAILPLAFVSLTPFLRISVVLHFLRQALGTQTIPSNQIIVVVSALLSLSAIGPQAKEIYENSFIPYNDGKLTEATALEQAATVLKSYLIPYTGEKEVALVVRLAKAERPKSVADLGFGCVAGAYVLSELRTSFKIGVLLYMPFLIVDLIVSAIIVTLGMIQLPPVMVSAPLKLLLFVLSDGWAVIIDSLAKSLKV
jgi:flagellar biosynthetic protein FliP